MYLLFQQQTTIERAASDNNMWGPFDDENPNCLKAFSLLRMFGPTTCMVAPDSRAERTKKEIISEATYNQMFQMLHKLPDSCRHVVVLLTVPIVFPGAFLFHAFWLCMVCACCTYLMPRLSINID